MYDILYKSRPVHKYIYNLNILDLNVYEIHYVLHYVPHSHIEKRVEIPKIVYAFQEQFLLHYSLYSLSHFNSLDSRKRWTIRIRIKRKRTISRPCRFYKFIPNHFFTPVVH